ncbi:MAG: HAMP domain-containing histidine kinase, partial [Phycisphaerae bacterium]|nr:HAMP domain-containing histidine kinase [Phycisphaerae bacterium]
MYTRLTILTLIFLSALIGLTWLGDHAINMLAQGLEDKRNAEFAEVGRQIRLDVMQKLDRFMKTEQDRPFTDYQDYFIPNDDAIANDKPNTLNYLSPIGKSMRNGLAFGHFQLDTNSNISAPYYNNEIQNKKRTTDISRADIYFTNIRDNLIPLLKPDNGKVAKLELNQDVLISNKNAFANSTNQKFDANTKKKENAPSITIEPTSKDQEGKAGYNRKANFSISSLQQKEQQPQIYTQQRAYIPPPAANASPRRQNIIRVHDQSENQPFDQTQTIEAEARSPSRAIRQIQDSQQAEQVKNRDNDYQTGMGMVNKSQTISEPTKTSAPNPEPSASFYQNAIQAVTEKIKNNFHLIDAAQSPQSLNDLVQIRIEPFVPLLVSHESNGKNTLFDGQIFLLRHVQVENDHFIQGFQLDENRLVETVRQSAKMLIRHNMDFELSQTENPDVIYTAILDFGFGNLFLHLKDTNPLDITNTINKQRYWYFSIITVVSLAVMLGILSVWRNMTAQVKLARKKDDFISAVSHELRTPLTSIRMFTEMLEKNWVKTEEKRKEYYQNMRQETERLSRLIENVLDFSRIQKKRKKFNFQVGDINQSIVDITESMSHYVQRAGFSIQTDLAPIDPVAYDKDAVMQILINLIDNAVKYAQNADDKTIIIR